MPHNAETFDQFMKGMGGDFLQRKFERMNEEKNHMAAHYIRRAFNIAIEEMHLAEDGPEAERLYRRRDLLLSEISKKPDVEIAR